MKVTIHGIPTDVAQDAMTLDAANLYYGKGVNNQSHHFNKTLAKGTPFRSLARMLVANVKRCSGGMPIDQPTCFDFRGGFGVVGNGYGVWYSTEARKKELDDAAAQCRLTPDKAADIIIAVSGKSMVIEIEDPYLLIPLIGESIFDDSFADIVRDGAVDHARYLSNYQAAIVYKDGSEGLLRRSNSGWALSEMANAVPGDIAARDSF